MCFICVDNEDFCELQSLALVIGREIFDITLQFLLCSLFSLSLTHTHDFSLQGHHVGFVSVWGDREQKIKGELCHFFAVLILIRPGTTEQRMILNIVTYSVFKYKHTDR